MGARYEAKPAAAGRMHAIRARACCLRCDGTGLVMTPEWADYWAAADQSDPERPALEPPEGPGAANCPECDGTGQHEYWADVEELVARLCLGVR